MFVGGCSCCFGGGATCGVSNGDGWRRRIALWGVQLRCVDAKNGGWRNK